MQNWLRKCQVIDTTTPGQSWPLLENTYTPASFMLFLSSSLYLQMRTKYSHRPDIQFRLLNTTLSL